MRRNTARYGLLVDNKRIQDLYIHVRLKMLKNKNSLYKWHVHSAVKILENCWYYKNGFSFRIWPYQCKSAHCPHSISEPPMVSTLQHKILSPQTGIYLIHILN